jgi:hypothetical protein
MPAARANVCFSGYTRLVVLTLSSSARDPELTLQIADYRTAEVHSHLDIGSLHTAKFTERDLEISGGNEWPLITLSLWFPTRNFPKSAGDPRRSTVKPGSARRAFIKHLREARGRTMPTATIPIQRRRVAKSLTASPNT